LLYQKKDKQEIRSLGEKVDKQAEIITNLEGNLQGTKVFQENFLLISAHQKKDKQEIKNLGMKVEKQAEIITNLEGTIEVSLSGNFCC